MILFWQLFYTFFLIGLFTIGGGYAMLGLIQNQVVVVHQWISAEAFTDIVAISQMTPGPIGINSATYIGYSVAEAAGMSHGLCIVGSFISTFAVVLPSFLIALWVCRLYDRVKNNHVFTATMKNIKPAVIGLIGAAAIMLMTPASFIDYKSWIIFASAFAIGMWTRISPIWTIILSGIAGFILYYPPAF